MKKIGQTLISFSLIALANHVNANEAFELLINTTNSDQYQSDEISTSYDEKIILNGVYNNQLNDKLASGTTGQEHEKSLAIQYLF